MKMRKKGHALWKASGCTAQCQPFQSNSFYSMGRFTRREQQPVHYFLGRHGCPPIHVKSFNNLGGWVQTVLVFLALYYKLENIILLRRFLTLNAFWQVDLLFWLWVTSSDHFLIRNF